MNRREVAIERQRFSFWLAAVAGMHIMLLLSAFAWQHFAGKKEPIRNVVSVSLVTLPGSGGSPLPAAVPGGAPQPEGGEPAGAFPESEPEGIRLEAAPPEPEKPKAPEMPVGKQPAAVRKEIPESPKKTENLGKALDKLRQSVESRSAEQQKQKSLGNALAKLQEKVARQGGAGGNTNGAGGGAGKPGTGSGGPGGGGGGKADPYTVRVASIIQQNWEFSSKMLQSNYGMEVYVHIFVLPDGTIRDIRYDKSSPSAYLNNSVKRALEQSSPLPPLPRENGTGGKSIGFVFTPEGIDM
ncbi:MAG: TonB family protein [Chlorobi bacterium]|nr:TonB family protein [Chlorobiota bacterium]